MIRKKKKGLTDSELRLISELMRDSRRSDRELARTLGISQPTVTRIRNRLEKEGYLREYTVIPDFNKLGYHIFAVTFFRWKEGLDEKEKEEARKWILEQAPSVLSNAIVMERGLGLGCDAFVGLFYKDYASYQNTLNEMKAVPFVDTNRLESFLVNLDDKIHFRYLTLSTFAKHILEKKE
jgi:DNA-binding Lrp family transcriptional regulator